MNQHQAAYAALETLLPRSRDWYRLHDVDRSGGAHRIDRPEAETWNRLGWGIFHTVNAFRGPRRAECLAAINSWAVDIDGGTKAAQLALIKKSPIFPSLVVETKSGYHVYWHAKDATAQNYEAIVSDRLIPYFKADPRAKDVSRLFRVPGFYHCKDPSNRFLVKVSFWNDCTYTETDMFYAFRLSANDKKLEQKKQELRRECGDSLWERIYNLDCVEALTRLSGTMYVGGEAYTFKPVTSGNLNIYVNGKSTSCFIDRHRRIGSAAKGGPTVYCWLKWFGWSNKETVKIIKEVFPELWTTL